MKNRWNIKEDEFITIIVNHNMCAKWMCSNLSSRNTPFCRICQSKHAKWTTMCYFAHLTDTVPQSVCMWYQVYAHFHKASVNRDHSGSGCNSALSSTCEHSLKLKQHLRAIKAGMDKEERNTSAIFYYLCLEGPKVLGKKPLEKSEQNFRLQPNE